MTTNTTTRYDQKQTGDGGGLSARPVYAVSYLRAGRPAPTTASGSGEADRLRAQRAAIHRKATSLGATLTNEFADIGASARNMDRGGLKRMLAFVEEHKVTYCIVHFLDRLTRNGADEAAIRLALKQAGVTLVTANEDPDETPSDRYVRHSLAAFHEYHSREARARIARSMEEKAKRGDTVGPAPRGYVNTVERIAGRLVRRVAIDEQEAPLIRRAFELFADGQTISAIATELAERGLTTCGTARRAERPITRATVARLLHDPYYAGVITHRGQQYPGRHEPLVGRELFDRVQARRRSVAKNPPTTPPTDQTSAEGQR